MTHVGEPLSDPTVPRLRADVALRQVEEGVLLEDALTGFRMLLDHDARATLEAIARGRVDAPPEEVDELRQLLEPLAGLGLLDEGLSPAEIRARQGAARREARADERRAELLDALRHASARVPLYRARFAEAGFSPGALEAFDDADLPRLPLLTKADIRRHFPGDLVSDEVDVASLLEARQLVMSATSGTSDERLECLSDARVGSLPARYHAFLGLPPDVDLGVSATFTSPLCAGFECHLGVVPMEQRIRGGMLALNSSDDILSFSDEEVRAVVSELERHEPRALFVNPWYAVWLSKRAAALGLELPAPAVVLSTYQYLTRRHRRLLEEAFRAPVRNTYSATELGGYMIATECAHGRMHVREDHVFVEILDDDGAPTAGGPGRLVVTSTANRVMPLVRYEVGDLASWADDCDCDFGTEWRCIRIEGRRRDAISAPDGTPVTVREADELVGDGAVDFWRLSQLGSSRYRLDVLDADPAAVSEARARLEGRLGEGNVEVAKVRHFSPERSLKYPQCVRVDGGVR